MTGWRRWFAVGLAGVLGLALLVLYREHRREVALESERDQPVVAPSRVRDENGEAVVVLDSAERRRVAVAVAALRSTATAREARLPGEVVPERERAAALRAPLSGRLSLPEGASWPRLGDHVRAGVPIAQVSDARPLGLPIDGVVTNVAAQPGALVEAGQVLLEVADFSRPLVRVAWLPDGGARPPPTIRLTSDVGDAEVVARLVGPSPEADPVTRRPAYLYRADRSWPGASPGTAVVALVARGGPQASAALVPGSAVVQWEGLAWAYVQRGDGRYARVRVPTDRPVQGGWAVGAPLAPGDTVVVRGAQELLSEEFRARVTVGDESGE